MEFDYKQCSRCILDTNDDYSIRFDEKGVCNYCRDYDKQENTQVFKGVEGERKLREIVDKIKEAGQNKPYDCIIGLSGGVDSSYLALQTKRLGLRPLAIHVDNGWNSELAMKNIENIVKKINIELYTHMIDWEEFKDLQLAYIRSSVVDIEMITDHAVLATFYKLAVKRGIKYILLGTNVVTEAILPSIWNFRKADSINIKAIHKEFGRIPLKTFPLLGIWTKKFYDYVLKIEFVSILNYIPYVKKEAKKVIIEELDWCDYGNKHYESIFTRFYQGYILPNKFKIDKRKAHLSNLICSGQITKADALKELERPIYDPQQLKIDKEFVLKKLGLSEQEFESIMELPIRNHTDFLFEKPFYKQYPILRLFRPLLSVLAESRACSPRSTLVEAGKGVDECKRLIRRS